MATPEQAVLAIRHAVQNHGDEDYHLGAPASIENTRWFGQLLGWKWPPSYIEVLAKHDGVRVNYANLLSFLESIELILIFHEEWHRKDGYWPVAHDECGNYYALSFRDQGSGGECPVAFLEGSRNLEGTIAASYADFVVEHIAEACTRIGCRAPIRTARSS